MLFRLKKGSEIKNVWSKGRGLKEGSLLVRSVENNLGHNRFGFVVPAKVSKKAVVRNKIRRRLSEIVRRMPQSSESGRDIIFFALPGMQDYDFFQTKLAVDKLLSKLKK